MNNNFESLGAHLRNLLTPYATLIQVIDDLYKADKNEDAEGFNKIKKWLYETQFNCKENINDINTFSFIEPMEQFNWRDTKLFKMDEALKEIDELTKKFGT